MFLHRIFHPVGQGAFFTESFCDIDNRLYYQVVYDCGTFTSPKTILQNKIEEAISGIICWPFSIFYHRHIDLLFLSHLDEDHVNGVKYLIDNRYLDKDSIIVLPFIKNVQMQLYDILEEKKTYSFLEDLRKHKFRAIFYIPETNDDESPEGYITINLSAIPDNLSDIPVLPHFVKESIGNNNYILKPNIKLCYSSFWEYTPFVIRDFAYAEFEKEIANVRITDQDIEGIYLLLKNKNGDGKNEYAKKYRKLKHVYKKIGRKSKGDTRININSLCLVSRASRKVESNYFFFGTNNVPMENYLKLLLNHDENNRYDHATCVYTGDSNLKTDEDYAAFRAKVERAKAGTVNLLQVPHHGSKTSYNPKLSYDLSLTCFTNYDTKKPIFSQDVAEDFKSSSKPLIRVTEDDDSMFGQEVEI